MPSTCGVIEISNCCEFIHHLDAIIKNNSSFPAVTGCSTWLQPSGNIFVKESVQHINSHFLRFTIVGFTVWTWRVLFVGLQLTSSHHRFVFPLPSISPTTKAPPPRTLLGSRKSNARWVIMLMICSVKFPQSLQVSYSPGAFAGRCCTITTSVTCWGSWRHLDWFSF